jgi:hypothetical protein
MRFQTQPSGFGGGATALTIDQDGNVGIGNPSPENKLTVVQTENATELNITSGSGLWGVLVETGNYTADRFVGMIAHRNANKEAQTGIWSEITANGSLMHLGTSDDYDSGVTVKNMTLKHDGSVGIGEVSPLGKVHIKSGDAGNFTPATNGDILILEDTEEVGMSIIGGNSANCHLWFGSPADPDSMGIVGLNSTDALSFYTNSAQRMTINSGGVHVDPDGPSAMDIIGDMADSGASPIIMRRLAHDGTIILFKSVNGDTGSIGVSGDTVSYNAFTGSHYCEPPVDAVPAYGEIVSFTGTNTHLNDVYPPTDVWRQAECDRGECTQEDVGTVRPVSYYGGAGTGEIIYGVEKTSTANDRKVLGGYFLTKPDKPDLAAAVGNYDIWVVDKGENITVGDWLISSDVSGHAMRDDGTTYEKAYAFAMAAENVDWSSVSETVDGTKHKKISVLFERFVRC